VRQHLSEDDRFPLIVWQKIAAMPKSPPFPMEDAPNYNPDDPFADKVALVDHRHYLLGQHFIKEGRVRVRVANSSLRVG
jgi:hypothetical protein